MYNYKKKLTSSLLIFNIFILFSLSLVSAQLFTSAGIGEVMRDGISFFTEFFRPILEGLFGDYGKPDHLFIKGVFFILLFVVIRAIISKTPKLGETKGVPFIIAIVSSIFAVRYITDSQLENYILAPYGALGIALLTIIPFIIFFYFVHNSGMQAAGRRLCWIFFLIILFVLWIYNSSRTSVLGNWMYGATFALIILSVFLDRQIRTYFALSEIKGMENQIHDKVILDLLDQLEKAERFGQTEQAKRIKVRLKELGIKKFAT